MADERALVERVRAELDPATVTSGPLVSIVILNRDGYAHLDRCLRALATTVYRDIEVIVIDNGSTDGSPDLVERLHLPFPSRVIRNRENRPYGDANAQGVALARGELICLLNNDVEPITEDWLGYMVETITSGGADAVGARLIYPSHRGSKRAGMRIPDLRLQHGGVDFDRAHGLPAARVVGAGGEPLGPDAGAVRPRPAVTAACLLIKRAALHEVGGFTSGYDYGMEDVDLCLKLGAERKRIVYDGRAALWHHESATRASDRRRYAARVKRNRAAFTDNWGPRLYREAMLDALRGEGRLSDDPFHVAITVTSHDPSSGLADSLAAHELGDALEALGWRVTYLQNQRDEWYREDLEADAMIVLLDGCDVRRVPRRVVTVAWVRDSPDLWLDRPWFDDFDLVLASSEQLADIVRARSSKVAALMPRPAATRDGILAEQTSRDRALLVRSELEAWTSAIRYGIRIGVPTPGVREQWGDYHFGHALQRALANAGRPSRLHILPEWTEPVAAREDVTIHLFGKKPAPTRPSQTNILWQISHPDLATPEMYERYDLAYAASDSFAARMDAITSIPVRPLHQATDPERFRPDPTGPHHELLFVANSRGRRRPIVDDLAGTTRDFAVYGSRWTRDLIDPAHVRGEYIPNHELRRYYSSADIVLNDHWADMRAEGFLSNRLYDAVACGAFVISDDVPTIDAEFSGAVVTYRSAEHLRELVDRYLADPAERRRLGERGRAAVLERHTFAQRVSVLLRDGERIAAERPRRILGTTKLR